MNLNIKLPRLRLFRKKRKTIQTKSRKTKLRRKITKKRTVQKSQRPLTLVEQGEELGKLTTQLWNSQQKPSKVYIGGKRIHHGLVGAVLILLGAIEQDDYIKGFGKALMKDDIDDLPYWLDFDENKNQTNGL